MKLKHFIITLLAFLASITTFAETWTDANGTVWSFITSGSNATLGKGNINPCISGTIPANLTVPSKVYIGETAYNVTSIGDYAFHNCSSLTSVTIPVGVSSIGFGAFQGCSSLTSVEIPNSVTSLDGYAFHGCTSLTSITIPLSVTNIGHHAFSSCSGLTSFTIPSRVTTIDDGTFNGCSELRSVIIPGRVTSLGRWTFYGCTSLTDVYCYATTPPEALEEYDTGDDIEKYYAFDKSIIQSATLHVPLASIDSYRSNIWSFFGTTVKLKIDFADANVKSLCVWKWDTDGDGELSEIEAAAVTDLGTYFKRRSNITSFDELQYFTGLTAISDNAFDECTNLTSVIIPYSVTSIGEYAFVNCYNLASVTIPNSVTSIGYAAFAQCYDLNSVTIPNSVTSIGTAAFSDCGSLTSVTIPNGVTEIRPSAFNGCESLTSITIPNSVTIIHSCAFRNCRSLRSITIPENVTYIGVYAFDGCYFTYDSFVNNSALSDNNNWDATLCDEETIDGLLIKNNSVVNCRCWATSVTIPNGVTSIGDNAFFYTIYSSGLTSVTIPNGVTSIGNEAFCACRMLTSVDIPNSVTSIGESAFYNCSGLTSITIPNSVMSIGNRTFEGCSGLTSLTIPNSVTSIGDEAFENCSCLTSLIIPNSVTSIGNFTFSGCSGLTSMTIGNSVTSLGNYTFSGCSGLTSVDIPNSVTSIGSGAFKGCSSLTSVDIPNSVTSIGASAFSGCSGLTSVTIPNSVTSIGRDVFAGTAWYNNQPDGLVYVGKVAYKYKGTMPANTSISLLEGTLGIADEAFSGCSGLTSMTIGNSVTSIGDEAFNGCSGLISLKVGMENPPSISYYTFSNRTNATLYVPSGSKEAYETANCWKQFKEIIEFYEGDVNGDGESDVVDVVDIARYVVGTPAETFVPILADINNSGEVNIADAVCLVNDIAGDQNFAKPMMAPRKTETSDDVLSLTEGENGVSLTLENLRNYTAFQFDLYVPENVNVMQMMLNKQRKQKHQLLYNKVEDGHWRVAALSTSNRTFTGNNGELLSFALDGISNEGVTLSNILFFDAEGNSYQFDDITLNGTTTIESPLSTSSKGGDAVYTLDGRRIPVSSASSVPSALPKGIYIVNGKKVVIK